MRKKLILPLWYLFLGITGCYLAARVLEIDGNARYIHPLMAVSLVSVLWGTYWKNEKGEIREESGIHALIAAGIILRIGYMLYTGCELRGHDLREISIEGGGHAGYLLTLIQQGQLPQSNELQFYQQPFFYIVGGMVSKAVNYILGSADNYYLVDAAKIVSCFASCAVLFCIEPLCNICQVKRRGRGIVTSMITFLPAAYLAGGRVNCDSLVAFFMTVLFLQTLRWKERPDWENTIELAVLYGLAMMTKITCGVMAVFTAGVFGQQLYRYIRQGKWRAFCIKYIVFAFISLPLGLWYSVRNYIKFGQSLFYVLKLPTEHALYRGEVPLMQRLFTPDIANLLQTPYANPWRDYNLPVYLLKSSLFGEFTYSVPVILPRLLLFLGVGLSVLTVVAVFWGIKHWKTEAACECPLIVFGMSVSAAWYFYIREPFGCAMDFRYSIFLMVPAAILIGKYYTDGKSKVLVRSIPWFTTSYAVCSMFFGILMM